MRAWHQKLVKKRTPREPKPLDKPTLTKDKAAINRAWKKRCESQKWTSGKP